MPELKKIQERIQGLAGSNKNVGLADIEWVVRRLEALGYKTRRVQNEHQILFIVEGKKFSVCQHHKGGSQIKACYVKQFLVAMMELGIYDDD